MSGYVQATPPQLLEDDDLDDTLQGLVAGITGLPGNLVRPRWQLVPPAELPLMTNWCAIGAQEGEPDAGPYLNQLADSLQFQRHLRITALASFYGPAARSLAGALRDGLSIAANRTALDAAGLGVQSIGTVLRMPDLMGQEWRNRADLQLQFNRQLDRSYPLGGLLIPPPVTFNQS